MPTLHPEGFRFNGQLYKTVEEFREAMLAAARARPELHPEGRPVSDPIAKRFEEGIRKHIERSGKLPSFLEDHGEAET